ncbi:MAG: 3-dehydroquinate synthase [Ignavibacteriae bacterium]|nr:3-dehydroquinate synthase [Ignavibacteriota bacterium]
MKKIKINIPNYEYNVYLGNNIFNEILKLLKKENHTGNYLIVVDKKVSRLYSNLIDTTFAAAKNKVKKVILESTEKNKSYSAIQKIHSALIKNNYGRDSVIIAIGGGIIGDVAGFAASTYMRGVKYIQVPTTLLASVDSSVGGKTGINFDNTKNIIGSFYQPKLVLIDTNFFKTLPKEEQLCGLGEIIKYAFLINENFFTLVKNNLDKILANEPKVIEKVIIESVKFKGSVVTSDEKEQGVRKILNLGHTFAHAFEVQQDHKLKHGQAVIVGITCALYLSNKINLVNEKDFSVYLNLLTQFSNKIKLAKVDKKVINHIMQRDKKNRDNQIKLVLLSKVGTILTDINVDNSLINQSISEAIVHF